MEKSTIKKGKLSEQKLVELFGSDAQKKSYLFLPHHRAFADAPPAAKAAQSGWCGSLQYTYLHRSRTNPK